MRENVDLEIIKSAILFGGDIDDAMARIRSATAWAQMMARDHPERLRHVRYLEALTIVREFLEGKIGVEDMRQRMLGLGDLFEEIGEGKDGLQYLTYILEFVRDRYNVRYPRYDMKRCDDL